MAALRDKMELPEVAVRRRSYTPRPPSVYLIALVGIGALLVWAHVAVAALAVCVNETPGLAIGMRESVPITTSIARSLLPVLGQAENAEVGSAQSCDAAAPARAMAVGGLAYIAGILVLYSR